MARIAGVNIPTNKRVVIALQYIHGIGAKKAQEINTKMDICVVDADPPPTLIFSSFFSCAEACER